VLHCLSTTCQTLTVGVTSVHAEETVPPTVMLRGTTKCPYHPPGSSSCCIQVGAKTSLAIKFSQQSMQGTTHTIRGNMDTIAEMGMPGTHDNNTVTTEVDSPHPESSKKVPKKLHLGRLRRHGESGGMKSRHSDEIELSEHPYTPQTPRTPTTPGIVVSYEITRTVEDIPDENNRRR
jgi:hypothetical protein